MASCTSLTADILRNCLPMTGGIADDYIYLIPFEAIDKTLSTENATNTLIIEALVLKTASPAWKAYRIQGIKFSNSKSQTFVKGTYTNKYDHQIMFRIMNNDPDVKKAIEELDDTRYVAIIKNNYNNSGKPTTPSDSVYEILGWDTGLEMATAVNDSENADLLNGWEVTLKSSDKHQEPRPARTLYKTDLATTEAIIASLL